MKDHLQENNRNLQKGKISKMFEEAEKDLAKVLWFLS